LAFAAALYAVSLGGCLVSDQLTTLTINPDGSADLILFRSNLRSTQQGETGDRELAEYKARFDSREDQDLQQITEAGGQILESSWVRSEAPPANIVHAGLPTAAALEKYGTTGSDGALATATRFLRDGSRRRLSIRITSSLSDEELARPAADAAQLKQQMADGISEIRIAVAGGAITASRGFTVAGDKQSALLDVDEIFRMLRDQSEVELFLEWEVN
jgi:hypothetical protein